jgi:hypothetical protein|tara:strand:- start:309 stop:626 length:318 start_codon:yes stop_codon:yes gene_type:complete
MSNQEPEKTLLHPDPDPTEGSFLKKPNIQLTEARFEFLIEETVVYSKALMSEVSDDDLVQLAEALSGLKVDVDSGGLSDVRIKTRFSNWQKLRNIEAVQALLRSD